MRIAQPPYQAGIVPRDGEMSALWSCVIQSQDSSEVIVRREASNKEDARCIALLELARLRSDAHREITKPE